MTARSFGARVLKWYDRHGRHDLPWQHPRTAYRVWVAEVMLQQTQVATVIPYFARFLKRFADVTTLAGAPQAEVLRHWAGLGYYARARNLHRAAQIILREHQGKFPRDFESALNLPGLGRSTAGAILAQAFGQKHPILDGNVRRVLARYYGIEGWPGSPAVTAELWRRSDEVTPVRRVADYTQAIMDLGATCCTLRNPDCAACPLSADCAARAAGRTAEIPAPRPRRERPQRSAQILVLVRRDGAVLLVQRPPTGIWGGLWSLPEVAGDDRLVVRHCLETYGLEATAPEPLPPIPHGFTHFDLVLQPRRFKVKRRMGPRKQEDSSNMHWYRPGATPPALPAPIRKLLENHRA